MTKRKTALQSAIDEIQDILDSRGANESNCDDYELGLIQSVKILKSKLPQEKQDLIDFGDTCKKEMYCDVNGNLKPMITTEELFDETFDI